MSKIGKKYYFYKTQSARFSEILNILKNSESLNDIAVNFNSQDNSLNIVRSRQIATNQNYDINQLLARQNITQTENYYNVNFEVDMHYEEIKELKKIKNVFFPPLKFKTLLEYNFYIKNYEDYLNNQENSSISERYLPNFYDVVEQMKDSKSNVYSNYYENPTAQSFSVSSSLKTVLPVYKNGMEIDKYYEKINPLKEQFPFYAEIKFDTHQLAKNSITRILQKNNLLDKLLIDVSQFFQTASITYQGPMIKDEGGSNSIAFDNIKATEYELNSSFIEKNINNIKDFLFINEINQKLYNATQKNLQEALKHSESEYSEVIGYRLIKSNETGGIIQEWYIPNLENETFTFIDTQIKYDKKYVYTLEPIILTFSFNYIISNFYNISNDLQTINIYLKVQKNNPTIKVYLLNKVNATQYTNSLLDYPPLEPEVEFLPYLGINNKIKINLNTSTGKKTVPYIMLSPSEKEKYWDKLSNSQNQDNNVLTFQTDEPSFAFYIYRSDVIPTSYSDFSEKFLDIVLTNGFSGGSYVDETILPNKKYYYIIRSVDIHGNFSNPTSVYEVELISEHGSVYPIINNIFFEEKTYINKQIQKSFKRFLKIKPAVKHTITDYKKSNETNNLQLGIASKNIWDKKFKIRLTSKTSAKKMDINFSFKYEKPIIPTRPSRPPLPISEETQPRSEISVVGGVSAAQTVTGINVTTSGINVNNPQLPDRGNPGAAQTTGVNVNNPQLPDRGSPAATQTTNAVSSVSNAAAAQTTSGVGSVGSAATAETDTTRFSSTKIKQNNKSLNLTNSAVLKIISKK